jgi:hypothetical protein
MIISYFTRRSVNQCVLAKHQGITRVITYPTNRRNPRHEALAHIPLNMILSSIPHTAHTHHTPFTSRERRFGREVLGAVASDSNGVSCDARVVLGVVGRRAVVEGRGVVGGEFGRFEVHVRVGERVLDRLVLADGAPEDDAFAGVVGRLLQCCVAESECFAGEEAAFCVHSVEDLGWLAFC